MTRDGRSIAEWFDGFKKSAALNFALIPEYAGDSRCDDVGQILAQRVDFFIGNFKPRVHLNLQIVETLVQIVDFAIRDLQLLVHLVAQVIHFARDSEDVFLIVANGFKYAADKKLFPLGVASGL